MKDILKFSLVALMLSVDLHAQEANFTLGENNTVTDFVSESFIGETDSEYLILSRTPSSPMVSLLEGGSYSFKFMRVAYYDKATLNKTRLLAFPKFDGEGVVRSGNVYINNSFIHGDTLHVFTTLHDKGTKNFFIHMWSFNANTLEALTPKAQLLGQLDESKFNESGVKVEFVEKLKQFVVVYFSDDNKSNETSINIARIDAKLNKLGSDTAALQVLGIKSELKDFEIDAKGNLYVLSTVYNAIKPTWESRVWMNVTRISAEGAITSNNIKLTDGNPFTGLLTISASGKVFACGYYALVVKPDGLAKVFSAGSFLAQIEQSSGDILKVETLELTDNQKKALFVKDMTPTYGAMSYYDEIVNLELKELYIDGSGNFSLVGFAKYSTSMSYGSTTKKTNYSNSIIVSKFNQSGNVEFNTVVPRFSLVSSMTYALHPIVYFKNGRLYILFNDNYDNMIPMNQLASGVKSKPKKNSKTIIHPPTDSDEIMVLDSWKGIDTGLRITEIDQQGLWQVYWQKPKEGKGSSPLPMIDGTCYFKDKKGNLVAIVFTKYSDLELVKSALGEVQFN